MTPLHSGNEQKSRRDLSKSRMTAETAESIVHGRQRGSSILSSFIQLQCQPSNFNLNY